MEITLCTNCFGDGCRKCKFAGRVTAPAHEQDAGSGVEVVSAVSTPALEDPKAIIENDELDALIRTYARRYGDNLEERTKTFRRIAAAAQAEADALIAIHELARARRQFAIDTDGVESSGGETSQ